MTLRLNSVMQSANLQSSFLKRFKQGSVSFQSNRQQYVSSNVSPVKKAAPTHYILHSTAKSKTENSFRQSESVEKFVTLYSTQYRHNALEILSFLAENRNFRNIAETAMSLGISSKNGKLDNAGFNLQILFEALSFDEDNTQNLEIVANTIDMYSLYTHSGRPSHGAGALSNMLRGIEESVFSVSDIKSLLSTSELGSAILEAPEQWGMPEFFSNLRDLVEIAIGPQDPAQSLALEEPGAIHDQSLITVEEPDIDQLADQLQKIFDLTQQLNSDQEFVRQTLATAYDRQTEPGERDFQIMLGKFDASGDTPIEELAQSDNVFYLLASNLNGVQKRRDLLKERREAAVEIAGILKIVEGVTGPTIGTNISRLCHSLDTHLVANLLQQELPNAEAVYREGVEALNQLKLYMNSFVSDAAEYWYILFDALKEKQNQTD